MVPATKPESVYVTSAYPFAMPNAASTPPRTSPLIAGMANWRLRLAVDAFRHAISGPMPVRASRSSPSGRFTALKNGGPTVIFSARTHSERIGNSVPHNTAKAIPTRTRLLYRKAASRLTMLSSSAFDSRFLRRVATR